MHRLRTIVTRHLLALQGEQMARNYRAQAMHGGSLLSTQQGPWAKDGKNFVYIERAEGDEARAGIRI
ncbi:lipopolysaccharide export system permease protein LptG [Salmonella enterica]|nr:lipopolysaccharide export system permease protein LptG [Salmonella enterica]